MMRGVESPFFFRAVDLAEGSAQAENINCPITAMVVEDESAIREVIDIALKLEGVRVIGQFETARDFFESTGISRDEEGKFIQDPGKSKFNGDKPDLVVTDLGIDGEGDTVGYDIARAAKKVFGSYNVLQSASSQICSEEERQKLGINELVTKPYDPFELANNIVTHIKQARNHESQKTT